MHACASYSMYCTFISSRSSKLTHSLTRLRGLPPRTAVDSRDLPAPMLMTRTRTGALQVATSIILGCLSPAALGPSYPVENGQECRFENNHWPIPCRISPQWPPPQSSSSPHQDGPLAGMGGPPPPSVSTLPKAFIEFGPVLGLGTRTHCETLLGHGQPGEGLNLRGSL